MKERKPRIGVVLSENPVILEGKYIINSPYIKAISRAGGIPLLLPAGASMDGVLDFAGLIDGLLVPGGQDVSPLLYGENPAPSVGYTLADTDRTEIALVREASKRGIPVFGICRGMQLINVAFGGTLIQDIPSEVPGAICHRQNMAVRSELTHEASIKENSLLSEILGAGSMAVNSFHHQAVKEAAPEFSVTAHSADGIAEGMESGDRRIFAVQWHPEELIDRYPVFLRLFEYLIKLAGKGGS